MSSTTLEWFIAQRGNFNWSSQPFATTLKSMIDTDFHEWGFVIYRCVYGTDEAWQRYIRYFKEGILEELGHDGGDVVLPQYAKWTVRDDRNALEGASIDTVRAVFVQWRDEHSVERDPYWTKQLVPHVVKDPPMRLPRFTYCIYVDQKCLNTVIAFAEKFPPPSRFAPIPPPLVAVMIDGDFDESQYVRGGSRAAPEDQEQFPAIDGRTCKYVGWEYVDVQSLGSLYDNLHSRRMDSPRDYKRPPKISPLGYEALTDKGIQRV